MKPTLKTLQACVLFTSLLASPVVFGGNGVDRGGGQGVVQADGSVRLRDMVDQGVCTWINGEEFQSRLTQYDAVLKPMQAVAPEFRAALYSEGRRLEICMLSSKLKSLPAEEQDGLTVYTQGLEQIAVRYNDEVYISEDLFNRMSPKEQALLYFHETMHSRIDASVTGRMTKLRSFVATVAAKMGSSFNKDEFERLATRNSVNTRNFGEFAIEMGKAAAAGNLSEVQYLLKKGYDSSTAMNNALRANQTHIVEYLVQRGFSIDVKSGNEITFSGVAQAARLGNAKAVRFLVEKGGTISVDRPLVQAARSGSLETVQTLIELKSREISDEEIHLAILQSIVSRNLPDMLVMNGERACDRYSSYYQHYASASRYTSLETSCYSAGYAPAKNKAEHLSVLKYLLSLNRVQLDVGPEYQFVGTIDRNLLWMDRASKTPALSIAASLSDVESAKAILDSGALRDARKAMNEALDANFGSGVPSMLPLKDHPALKSLGIEWGSAINRSDVVSTLMKDKNYAEAEKTLLIPGVRVSGSVLLNQVIDDEKAPASLAQALIAAGADVNGEDRSYPNLILKNYFEAKESDTNGGRLDQIFAMIAAQPSFKANAKSQNRDTALEKAAYMGLSQTVQALVKRKDIDINPRDSGGVTPLMTAAMYGRAESVRILLAQPGIDLGATSTEGKNAFQIGYCNAQIREMLKSAGARLPLFSRAPSCN